MTFFALCSILITLTALFSFINCRFIRLPTTIGIMLLSLAGSLVLIGLGRVWGGLHLEAARIIAYVDFHETVIHWMLALLLFAGALHLDFGHLRRQWAAITSLALIGTIVSTGLVTALCWIFFRSIGHPLPGRYCFLFGALISPTDPIAVLALMKNVRAPRVLETQLAGESLFNDGVGVVIFLTALGLTLPGHTPSAVQISLQLFRQVAGGAGLGLICGYVTYRLLRMVNNYQVEVLLTLALAMGSFALAEVLDVSPPIEVVVAGLFIGNTGRELAMSNNTRERLDAFWELVDEILNSVLFLLIGLEMLVMPLTPLFFWAGLACIAITLFARWVSVAGVVAALRLRLGIAPGTIRILTWGGLRGGLSVAMALSIPRGEGHDAVLAITYMVVVFSVFAQGLSVGSLMRRLLPTPPLKTHDESPN